MTPAWRAFTPDAPACAFLPGAAGVRSLCGAIRRLPEIFAQSNAEQRPRCGRCTAALADRARAARRRRRPSAVAHPHGGR